MTQPQTLSVRRHLRRLISLASLTLLILFCLSLSGCGSDSDGGNPENNLFVYKKYEDYFAIGAAVDSQTFRTHEALLTAHFNSVTPENEMKFESSQRNEGEFLSSWSDKIVNFAAENEMRVRGHALIWHRQTPAWVFQDGDGPASKALLLQRMKSHIDWMLTHFKGKVDEWDVVNEAIMDDGSYRTGEEEQDDQKSKWFEILGESYIAEAFRYAHAADPDVKLFYNDYYNYLPARHQAIYEMLKGLLEANVPVHGVGLQCHLNIEPSSDSTHQAYYQTVENLETAIALYASLGLEVAITEMDVSLYVPGVIYAPEDFYTQDTFTEALASKQSDRYRTFFEMFRRHRDVITSVTLWGVADDSTWLSEFDSGRKDFPLLFDDDHQPKPAFDGIMQF